MKLIGAVYPYFRFSEMVVKGKQNEGLCIIRRFEQAIEVILQGLEQEAGCYKDYPLDTLLFQYYRGMKLDELVFVKQHYPDIYDQNIQRIHVLRETAREQQMRFEYIDMLTQIVTVWEALQRPDLRAVLNYQESEVFKSLREKKESAFLLMQDICCSRVQEDGFLLRLTTIQDDVLRSLLQRMVDIHNQYYSAVSLAEEEFNYQALLLLNFLEFGSRTFDFKQALQHSMSLKNFTVLNNTKPLSAELSSFDRVCQAVELYTQEAVICPPYIDLCYKTCDQIKPVGIRETLRDQFNEKINAVLQAQNLFDQMSEALENSYNKASCFNRRVSLFGCSFAILGKAEGIVQLREILSDKRPETYKEWMRSLKSLKSVLQQRREIGTEYGGCFTAERSESTQQFYDLWYERLHAILKPLQNQAEVCEQENSARSIRQ